MFMHLMELIYLSLLWCSLFVVKILSKGDDCGFYVNVTGSRFIPISELCRKGGKPEEQLRKSRYV